MAAAILYLALSPWVWSVSFARDAFLWVGADGGRLADTEPFLLVLAAARAVVVTPAAEEMLFRGLLFGWIRGRVAAPVAIVTTAALFALAHPMPVLWPGAFFLGVAAAWYRERADSTTPLLIAHMVNNAALVVASYLFTRWHVPQMM